MLALCGYNFCRDKNALDAGVAITKNINGVYLRNGIFDHWNLTQDVTSAYTPDIPTIQDVMTVIDANFNGNLNGGNIDFAIDNISGVRIKRRKKNTFDWVTLKFIPKSDITSSGNVVNFIDYLSKSGQDYEYAIVPVYANVEGDYIIDDIFTNFDGVFICDQDTIYKFYAGVQYGASTRVQKVGVFEPYGRQYPVVVSNALIDYERGSITGTILPNDYLKTGNLDRVQMVKERKQIVDFLCNKKAKILKDWNGNCWLLVVVDSPTISFNNSYGMGIADVGASYVEIGDYNKQKDLYESGIIQEVQ